MISNTMEIFIFNMICYKQKLFTVVSGCSINWHVKVVPPGGAHISLKDTGGDLPSAKPGYPGGSRHS